MVHGLSFLWFMLTLLVIFDPGKLGRWFATVRKAYDAALKAQDQADE